MKVLKFGGTSVGSAKRMKNLVDIIQLGGRKIVVLSAMSGTTDALVSICRCVNENKIHESLSELDQLKEKYKIVIDELLHEPGNLAKAKVLVEGIFAEIIELVQSEGGTQTEAIILSKGELLSTNLFHLLLEEKQINSTFLPALDFMRTNADGEPDTAYITQRLGRLLTQNPEIDIFVTQGFICLNSDGQIDNLGRGGSDYSASLMGAAINADDIQIWTDVDGLQNNDPRYVDSTMPVRELSFDEAAELAYFGAKILHPASILPAKRSGVPVLLKNTMNPDDPGTEITNRRQGSGFKAVAAKDNITAVKIRSSRMLMAYGFIRKVFEIFEKFETPVDMVTTSEVAISATIDNISNLSDIVSELEQLGQVSVDHHQTIIAAVGEIVAEENGHAEELFSSLSNIPVRMISYGASSHNISILVNTSDKIKTLRAIHSGVFNVKAEAYV